MQPHVSNECHGDKFNDEGYLCGDELLHDGRYNLYSSFLGFSSSAVGLKKNHRYYGRNLPEKLEFYGAGPYQDKIYLVGLVGKCLFCFYGPKLGPQKKLE